MCTAWEISTYDNQPSRNIKDAWGQELDSAYFRPSYIGTAAPCMPSPYLQEPIKPILTLTKDTVWCVFLDCNRQWADDYRYKLISIHHNKATAQAEAFKLNEEWLKGYKLTKLEAVETLRRAGYSGDYVQDNPKLPYYAEEWELK